MMAHVWSGFGVAGHCDKVLLLTSISIGCSEMSQGRGKGGEWVRRFGFQLRDRLCCCCCCCSYVKVKVKSKSEVLSCKTGEHHVEHGD